MQNDAFVYYSLEFKFRCCSSFFFFSEYIFQFKSVHEESVIRTMVKISYG